MLPSWWNSLESVSKFNGYVQLAIIGFGIATALAMFIGFKASQRIETLQKEEKEAIKSELKLTKTSLVNYSTQTKEHSDKIKLVETESKINKNAIIIAKQDAQIAKNKTEELKKQSEPRRLTKDQKFILETEFNKLVHRFNFTWIGFAMIDNDETQTYAKEIFKCFESSVTINQIVLIAPTPFYGIVINDNVKVLPSNIANGIANIFRLAGIDYIIGPIDCPQAAVAIGLKTKK